MARLKFAKHMKTILNQQSIPFGLGLVHSRVRLQANLQGMPEAYMLTKKDAGVFLLGDKQSIGAVCASHDVPKRKKQVIVEQWNSVDVKAQVDIRVAPDSVLHYIVLPTSKKILNKMHSIDRRITVGKNACVIFTELSAQTVDRVSQTQISLVAEGAKAKLNTAFIGQGAETHHLIHHVYLAAKQTEATIDSYGLLQEKSRGIYRAQIMMEKGVTGAKGKQSAHVLLDGKDVRIDAVPELDVAHNLVQCEHGVSISQMNEDSLFYAQSRGISKKQAQAMIKKAHIEQVVSQVPKGEIKEKLNKMIGDILFLI